MMTIKDSEQREKQEQKALVTLGEYALVRNDLDSVVHRALQQSCILLELKYAAFSVLNQDKETFMVKVDSGCDITGAEIENNERWDMGFALTSDKPVIVSDYREEQRFKLSPLMREHEVVSSAHVAVRGEDTAFGVFCFYADEKRTFSEHDLNFIQIVANMVGMAIERARAHAVLEEKNRRLREEMSRNQQFQRDIIDNSIRERWDLGSYLHDNLAQMLATAKIIVRDVEGRLRDDQPDAREKTKQVEEILDDGIAGIRTLMQDIIPIDLEEDGIVQALRLLARQTEKMHEVVCSLQADDAINDINDIELVTHIYHIIQEALKNAAMHGQADRIDVAVRKREDSLTLVVKDNGRGMAGLSESEGGGNGIRIMKHRVELLKGEFTIANWEEDGRDGTLIRCHIPL